MKVNEMLLEISQNNVDVLNTQVFMYVEQTERLSVPALQIE
jgi:hypothetical protein